MLRDTYYYLDVKLLRVVRQGLSIGLLLGPAVRNVDYWQLGDVFFNLGIFLGVFLLVAHLG